MPAMEESLTSKVPYTQTFLNLKIFSLTLFHCYTAALYYIWGFQL
jgi:hypothetical protein